MAAYPNDLMNSTTNAVFIPSIWADFINGYFRQALTLGSFFTNRSDELAGGGNILYTPGTTALSAVNRSAGSSIQVSNPTETSVTLTINTQPQIGFGIDDQTRAIAKKSLNFRETRAEEIAHSVALAVENGIAALFASVSGLTAVGASTSALVDSDVRTAIGRMQAANVPMANRNNLAFIFHPNNWWSQILASDRFVLTADSGVNSGVFGIVDQRLYGFPVRLSVSVPVVNGGRRNMLIHKDAIHIAFAPLPTDMPGVLAAQETVDGTPGIRVVTGYDMSRQTEVTSADCFYGVAVNRANAGIALIASNI
jgi:hypothetical protein